MTHIMASVVITLVVLAFIFTTVGLLIARLNNGTSPSAGVVLIPIFIITSLVFCCLSCCLPLSVIMTRFGLEEELRGAGGDGEDGITRGGAEVAMRKRIDNK